LTCWQDDGVSDYYDLFELPAAEITYAVLTRFVVAAEDANALAESRELELKEKRDKNNISEAVAALANTAGGVVLVGVAEDKRGIDRLVGVPLKENDSISVHLRDVLGADATPEQISVRKPDTDRCIVVLRINAETVRHPVVVSGKVLVRIPGSSRAAERDEIVRLANRDVSQSQGLGSMSSSFMPGHVPLWAPQPWLELRVSGTVHLPNNSVERDWLGSAEKAAIRSALTQGPVPKHLWRGSVAMQEEPWSIVDARATWLRLASRAQPEFVSDVQRLEAAAHVHLAGSNATTLIAVGLFLKPSILELTPAPNPLPVDLLHETLIGCLVSHARVCRALADSLGAGGRMTWGNVQAWLNYNRTEGGQMPASIDDVINVHRWPIDTDNQLPGYWFRQAATPRDDIDAITRLAQEWLTLLLLDAGARDFEADLESMEAEPYIRAEWKSVPHVR
jgi:hypothetical protein